jgi:hypothetical protein
VPYDLTDQRVVTRLIWEEQSFLFWAATMDIPLNQRPLDGLVARNNTTTQRQQDANAPDGGEHVYRYPGFIVEPLAQEGLSTGTFKQKVAEEIFYRWGRGAPEVSLKLLPGFVPKLGEFVVNRINFSPIPEAGGFPITIRPKDYPSRDPRQVLQLVKRSTGPAGVDGLFLIVGPVAADVEDVNGALPVPELTIEPAPNKPKNVALLTVTNWSTIQSDNDNRVQLQYNTGATEPTTWNEQGDLYPTGTGVSGTPLLPAGSHVWMRARTWNLDGRFSDWSDVVNVDLDELDPPENFVGTRIGDTLGFVFTWDNGEPDEGVVLRYAEGLATEYIEIGFLPAGTTRFEFAFDAVNTSYRVEIFHRQFLPVLSESAHVEITVTTGTTIPQLDPPTDPDASTGSGTLTLCVDVGDVDADETVFQYAPEIADGSFGAWVTFAIEAHTGSRVCGSASVPLETSLFDPSRNRFYQVQAYHRATGFVDSDPTDAITVDPWQVSGPADVFSLINNDADFLTDDDGLLLEGED